MRSFISSSKPNIFRDAFTVFLIVVLSELSIASVIMNRLNEFSFSQTDPRTDDEFRFDSILKMNDKSGIPVYILGSSSSRELIDSERVNRYLQMNGFGKYEFYNLGASGMIVQDYFLMLDKITENKPALVVLEIIPTDLIPYKFSKLAYYRYLPGRIFEFVRMYGIVEFVKRAHYHLFEMLFNSYLPNIRNSRLIFSGIESRFILGNSGDAEYFSYDGRKPKLRISQPRERAPKYPEFQQRTRTIKTTRAMLKTILEELKRSRITVVLMTPPLTRKFYEMNVDFDNRNKQYMEYLKNLSQEFGADLRQYDGSSEFSSEYFYDDRHVNESGRDKFTEIFEKMLVEYL